MRIVKITQERVNINQEKSWYVVFESAQDKHFVMAYLNLCPKFIDNWHDPMDPDFHSLILDGNVMDHLMLYFNVIPDLETL